MKGSRRRRVSPAGTGDWVAGTGACQLCDAGKYSEKVDGEELYKCVACAAGTYSEAGPAQTSAEVCEPCRGHLLGKSRADLRLELHRVRPRPVLESDGQSAAGSCKDCAAGRYTNTSGQLKCEPCAAGREAGSGGSKECSAATLGSTKVEAGQAACVQCPKGEYQNATGAVACKECGVNRFANETSQRSLPQMPNREDFARGKCVVPIVRHGQVRKCLWLAVPGCQPGRFRENLDRHCR